METYIKLYRRILDWEWYSDTNTIRVFLHILLRANYEPNRYKGQVIAAGECVFGRKVWAKELGLSERQVRTAIEHLKSTNEISTRATNQFTVISVVRWGFWQMCGGQATNETTNEKSNERPTSDQRATTSKEIKNIRNKEDIYSRVIAHLNEAANTHYKSTTEKTKKLIRARLNDGFTEDDFISVIDKKCADWLGTEFEKFLRPETLFGNKFEGYLNARGNINARQTARSDGTDRSSYAKKLFGVE